MIALKLTAYCVSDASFMDALSDNVPRDSSISKYSNAAPSPMMEYVTVLNSS